MAPSDPTKIGSFSPRPLSTRAYYSAGTDKFLTDSEDEILGCLTRRSEFTVLPTQRDAWIEQIRILKQIVNDLPGVIHFEFVVPRMGHRIDAVLLVSHVLFALEFKVGETEFHAADREQAWDYGLDLKNFHETSHEVIVAPILIATDAPDIPTETLISLPEDRLLPPMHANSSSLKGLIRDILQSTLGPRIEPERWLSGRYAPTPTILEAARALYNGHGVEAISRSDASATNLSYTSDYIESVIRTCRDQKRKAICFVTGVPGAGKTLVGLNVATRHRDTESTLHSVFLSGNGPLVRVLCEALARDKVQREKSLGRKITKKEARSEVKAFIQNVHHFRDDCLSTPQEPPIEHVALFDEAQRAWDLKQTSSFMIRKKGVADFDKSEPEFLISCLDRHQDWAVVICLVGGGQEINTGEAGIAEWIEARNRSYPDWEVHISPNLRSSEYAIPESLLDFVPANSLREESSLHLGVSLRSFRAEHLSRFVRELLDLDINNAQKTLSGFRKRYPILLTRDLSKAKMWLRSKARGSERYGMVVSSQAERLKPHAIDVRVKTDPVNWFLNSREDVRSSYYLEDVATEFDVQGLELDWACIVWDGDFRHTGDGWQSWSFRGSKWQRILKKERKRYLLNAYRVLLTRARQGIVIVVPEGEAEDPTRDPTFYDSTFSYLQSLGLEEPSIPL